MVKTKSKITKSRRIASSSKTRVKEPESVYFLKLVLYLILGSQWLRITKGALHIPIPIGLLIGIMFTRAERFKIDRKIDYAILLVATFIGFWLPLGIEIAL